VAGPWFMVAQHNDDWEPMAELWVSDGQQDCQGRIEIRIWLDDGSSLQPANAIHQPIASSEMPIVGPSAGVIR